MANETTYRLAYRPDIDGLRAIAVAAVVVFHAFPGVLPGGFTGVDIFFVISGFLISSLIWEGLGTGTFTIRSFYRRRVVRLFPALVTVLAVVAFAAWRILPATGFNLIRRDVVAAATFSSNLVYWHTANYFTAPAQTQPLTHLWSLAVEEQFYLVWPLLLIATRRARWILLLVFGASFATNVAFMHHTTADFYLLPTRAWELALGGIVAWWAPHVSRRASQCIGVVGLCLVVLAVLGPRGSDPYPGWWGLAPVAAAAVIIGAPSFLNRVLSTKPFVSLGKVSYPLYLWHFPALVLARIVDPTLSTTATLAVIGVSVALAYITYFAIERPAQAWNRRSHRIAIPSLAAGMMAVASLGLISTPVAASTKARFSVPQLGSYVYKSNSWRGGQCFLNEGQTPSAFHGCITGSGPLVVEFGDSHAAQFTYPLHRDSNAYHYRFAQFTASSCPPVANFNPWPGCSAVNSWVMHRIAELHPEEVILAALWRSYPIAVDRSVAQTIRSLHHDGVANVVLVGNVPTWTTLLPQALYVYASSHRDRIPTRMSFASNAAVDRPSDRAMRLVAKETHATYVSPISILCNPRGCLTRVGNHLNDITAFDWEHLTNEGAAYVVGHDLSGFLPRIAN